MTTLCSPDSSAFRLIEHALYDGHPTWVAVFRCPRCGYQETAFLDATMRRYPCFVCGTPEPVPPLPVSL